MNSKLKLIAPLLLVTLSQALCLSTSFGEPSSQSSFYEAGNHLLQIAQAAGTSAAPRITANWCQGGKALCFFDPQGKRINWAREYIRSSPGTGSGETIYITGGYPEIEKRQKEYLEFADGLYSSRLIAPLRGLRFGRGDTRYHSARGWNTEDGRFEMPDSINTDGALDITTLKIPYFEEAVHTLRLMQIFFEDCKAAPGGETFFICNAQLGAAHSIILSVVPYPNERLRARGLAIRKALIASLDFDHLVDELKPFSDKWPNSVEAKDKDELRGHLEPNQISAAFSRRLAAALEGIQTANIEVEEAKYK